MAKHRIRRWFRFGILDLLILTAVVAIATFLWQPAKTEEAGTTMFFGLWMDDNGPMVYYKDHALLDIWPDGAYLSNFGGQVNAGPKGEIEPLASEPGTLVFRCGGESVWMDSPGGILKTLRARGYVLTKKEFWSGQYRHGLPNGKWTVRDQDGQVLKYVEYREGVVHDILTPEGQADSHELDSWRWRKGLDRKRLKENDQ